MVGPDFKKHPLVPVIAQDQATGMVLMLAYMNEQAYQETLATRRVCYFSRSRNRLWRKGEESGHFQELIDLYFDCDADALLVKVNQVGGAACHEGFQSCFFRRVAGDGQSFTIEGERLFDPATVYGKK
jgi:phosphoribosyl-AMP cyclohydrolase